MVFLRIPRSCTANPTRDYSRRGSDAPDQAAAVAAAAAGEDPEARRQRTERFKTQILLEINGRRALREQDVLTETEARAYLSLHDYDLGKAVDAMEQDQELEEEE